MSNYNTIKRTAGKNDLMEDCALPVGIQKITDLASIEANQEDHAACQKRPHLFYRNMDELPFILGVNELHTYLGISRAGAYQLLHREDFPTLHIESRRLVSKEGLKKWLEQHTNGSNNWSDGEYGR